MRIHLKTVIILFIGILLFGCATTPSIQDQTSAETNMMLGLLYVQQGNLAQANQTLTQANQEDPGNPRIKDALAYYYETAGDSETADHWYRAAIAQAPKEGALHNNYGTFLCRQHRVAEAQQQFLLAEQSINYAHPAVARENAKNCKDAV